jgi:alpha-2-macroglobulin
VPASSPPPTAALAQPLLAPSDVYPQFGGLEIQTSSTALQALTDAMIYLVSYPYEGSEQIASRILAVAALRDVLAAFDAEELPSESELINAIARDIDVLRGMQNPDGGFPVWQRNKPSWPFHSIHAAHALARARQKGFDTPQEMIDRALHYLRQIESHYPSTYSTRVRNTLTAYSLYVRQQFGDHDPARGRQLVRETGVEELSFEALGWLLNVLADDPASTQELAQIQRHLANRIAETPGAANFITAYREEEGYLLLASNRRADGILLEGMIRTDPRSDLIPKLVHGLLAHRTRGHWGNTQENVFILLALDSYFQTYEAQTPEFVARAWLGDQYVGEFQFVGRTTEYQTVMVPMAYLADLPGQEDLIISKEGPGRLYYRLGLRYAPTNLQLAPLDEGFVVERSYEAVDDPDDVWQDADGGDQIAWHVRAGARVRVRIRMVAPSRRYHVALADPLPAGLEIINPDLAVSGELPTDPVASESRFWWWRWTWYEHQNLRDQRAEAFASLLWEGIHTYSYVARATTPGRFVVPPARAEEMYSPEVFGRSGTDWLIVE